MMLWRLAGVCEVAVGLRQDRCETSIELSLLLRGLPLNYQDILIAKTSRRQCTALLITTDEIDKVSDW